MVCWGCRYGAHYIPVLAVLALTIWEFVEIGCLRGAAGFDTYGLDPLFQVNRRG
jgi:hypothetical protein